MKSDDFKTIFRAAFDDPPRWRDWFFSEVACDEAQIRTLPDRDGHPSAAMLMQPYAFLFHGAELRSEYISCVATLPSARSQGLATRLMEQSLADAAARGVALCELIPADDALYGFYRRSGFAPVFYAREDRYTALHRFDGAAGQLTAPSYDILHRLETRLGCGVLHSAADYSHILADMAIDGGDICVAARDGSREAILFAVADSGGVRVKCLLADSEGVAMTVLAALRQHVGDAPLRVLRPADGGGVIRRSGMARIMRPADLLAAVAAAHPGLRVTVSLRDSLLPANDGLYTIADGRCAVDRGADCRHADLDVDITVLADILFGTHRTGNIVGIPSRRPFMALMLD